MTVLFPIQEYWWFYGVFCLFICAVLALDLGVFHRKAHEVSFKEASFWTVLWIGLALAFNILFYFYASWKFGQDSRLLGVPDFDPLSSAKQVALEFLTGYVVEKSLAIDNVFVFAVIFSYFAIPKIYQHRILFYGILGALVFRASFIALGSYLMTYKAVLIFFGALLILTGFKMFRSSATMMDPERNILIRWLKKIMRVHSSMDEGRFFVRVNGLLHVTPLFLALVFVELSDIIFAVDSVPAIFALTREPLIVFTSNIFAILGLRSMYFMLAGIMDRFVYIKYGLASVLIFVGLKMVYLNEAFGGKFPISWSLMIIVALMGTSILVSLKVTQKSSGTAGQ